MDKQILDRSILDAARSGGVTGAIAGGVLATIPGLVEAAHHTDYELRPDAAASGHILNLAGLLTAGVLAGGTIGAGTAAGTLGIKKLRAWNALRRLQERDLRKITPRRVTKHASVKSDASKQILLGIAAGAGIGAGGGALLNKRLKRRLTDKRLTLGGAGIGAVIGLLAGLDNAEEVRRDAARKNTLASAHKRDKNGAPIKLVVDARGYHAVTDPKEIEKAWKDGRVDLEGYSRSDGEVHFVRQWYIEDEDAAKPKLTYKLVPAEGALRETTTLAPGVYSYTRPTPIFSSRIPGLAGRMVDSLPLIRDATRHGSAFVVTDRPSVLTYTDRKGKVRHALYAQNKDGSWSTGVEHTAVRLGNDNGLALEKDSWHPDYWRALYKSVGKLPEDTDNSPGTGHLVIPQRGDTILFDATLENPNEKFVWVDEQGRTHTTDPAGVKYKYRDKELDVTNLSMLGSGRADAIVAALSPDYTDQVSKHLRSTNPEKRNFGRSQADVQVFRVANSDHAGLTEFANMAMQSAIDGQAQPYVICNTPWSRVRNCLSGVSDSINRGLELKLLTLDENTAPSRNASIVSTISYQPKHDPAYGAIPKYKRSAEGLILPDYWDFNTNTFKSQP